MAIRRREFTRLLGGALALPLAARAQQSQALIGFLSSRSPGESAPVVAAFRDGLRNQGFVEGQNVNIAFRWADGRYDRLPALAAELVGLRVALLFAAGGPPSALAAKRATSTIPIVFSAASDPVRLGLVASLSRPGANITGMSTLTTPLGAKGIELLKELLPKASAIGYLVNPSNPSGKLETGEADAAADAIGVRLRPVNASTVAELDKAFATLGKMRVDGLVVAGEPFFDSQREEIVALAARYGIPTSYAWRENVVAGGLMSYGASLTDSYRQAGIYAGRILKGEKPADLPVMQPAKFELVLNLKTARALNIAIPQSLLVRADEVIQ
ncbi:MAG TPA: ABC transporter substrate-binding protein [Casimicrobiaceae bacterium]|nr:ABC transporter substrate-binding protein [Casimicrobiaceae bacterium]